MDWNGRFVLATRAEQRSAPASWTPHDMAHFVVQSGALLGRYPPDRAVELLCSAESPGDLSLRARGRTTADAIPLLEEYLATASPTEPRAIRYTEEILKVIDK